MSRQSETMQQLFIKTEYESVRATRKLNLLLQRSVRYSYRQRCCGCCPTILCELLFPLLLIIVLLLGRYGINKLAEELDGSKLLPENQRPCSQNLTIPTSSKEIMATCFRFPPRYADRFFGPDPFPTVSNQTNIVFEPNRTDINDIVERAKTRLSAMQCTETFVW